MYVPGVTKNMISVSMITDQDLKVKFLKSNYYIKDLLDGMKTIAKRIWTRGLYKLDVRPTQIWALTTTSLTTEELWHQIFGHINYNDLLLLQKKEMVRDLPMLKQVHNDCDVCTLGKMHREEFPVRVERKQRDILELVLVFTDLCGPMQTKSLGGALYFLLFIGDCTKFSWYIYWVRKFTHLNTLSSS